jgi:5-methylcytosine-specific restriction endonuclease McrA
MPTKAWKKANPDKWKAQCERYRKKNRDAINRRAKKYREENKEKIAKRLADWASKNRKRYSEIHQKWKRANRDKVNAATSRKRALHAGLKEHHTAEEWAMLKHFHGYSCLRCLKSEPEIKLARDHVMPMQLGGSDTIDNIQPLCKSCNSKKGIRYIDYRFCSI